MDRQDEKRRNYLKWLVAGTAVATGAALSAGSTAKSATREEKRPGEKLYRETEAFRKYYESLR